MRILKFLGFFLGAALVVFVLVIGLNWDAFRAVFENRAGWQEGRQWVEKTYSLKGLTEYIGENPEHVSIVSYDIAQPDSGIYYRTDEPRVMGTTSNLLLLIEYARQVENGQLFPGETVPLDTLSHFGVPEIENAEHRDALDAFEERGLLLENGQVHLDDLVQIMVEYNDLRMADYLYFRLGVRKIDQLIPHLELQHTEMPLPFFGLYIAMNPKLYDATPEQRLQKLQQIDRRSYRLFVINAARKYLQDPAYRDKVNEAFSDGLDLEFITMRDYFDTMPKTTAGDIASLMEQLIRGKVISPTVSQRVLSYLSWPMRQQQLHSDMTQYYALYEDRMGILNGADLGTSKYTGATVAQAVFFDDLPIAFWFHMSSNHMLQDFQQRLIWDPALYQTTRKATQPDSSQTDSLQPNGQPANSE